jgi:hypothetical protein
LLLQENQLIKWWRRLDLDRSQKLSNNRILTALICVLLVQFVQFCIQFLNLPLPTVVETGEIRVKGISFTLAALSPALNQAVHYSTFLFLQSLQKQKQNRTCACTAVPGSALQYLLLAFQWLQYKSKTA